MSAAWMSGYVSDVAYTLGYYRELAPTFLQYVCTLNGFEGLREGRRLRYCELGCGRGYGTALLAAANPDIDFVGIDFNPTHVGEARALAARANLRNVSFLEVSFGEATQSSDPALAEFDVVALHGVYSWVDAKIRRDIVDFLRTKLVPGGVAYISYNTFPGWSAAAPLQHLLKEFANRSSGDSLERLSRGRDLLKRLSEKSCAYIMQNPGVKNRIEAMGSQDVHYLVHEFLNAHWAPLYVTDAFRDFADAKLTYIGSANVGENRPIFAVPQDMFDVLDQAPDPTMREQLKDYATNKQFRRDVYVKGPIRLTGAKQKQRFNETRFALAVPAREPQTTWRVPSGEARLKPGIVKAIFDRLKDGMASGAELRDVIVKAGFQEEELQGIMEILVHNYHVAPGRSVHAGQVDTTASLALNDIVYELATTDDTHRFLAAPAIGSAIGTNFFERLLIPAMRETGSSDPRVLANAALEKMESSGKRMSKDGEPIGRERIDDIVKIATEVRELSLPRWRDLGIVR